MGMRASLSRLAIELCYWRVAIDELNGPKRNISDFLRPEVGK